MGLESRSGAKGEGKRTVGGREFKVTYLDPEDPQSVRERDKTPKDFIGRKQMGRDYLGNKIGLRVVGTNTDSNKAGGKIISDGKIVS